MLFLDNAYIEFCDTDYLPLLADHENLVIGRTMSKAYALAGARVGYAFAPAWILPYYRRASTPFTLNSLSAHAAIGALDDREGMEAYVRHVRLWREKVFQGMRLSGHPFGCKLHHGRCLPMDRGCDGGRTCPRGVIVRSCASFRGLPDHFIRVSIGADWENGALPKRDPGYQKSKSRPLRQGPGLPMMCGITGTPGTGKTSMAAESDTTGISRPAPLRYHIRICY